MPLYTFKCSSCTKQFEQVQKLADFTGSLSCPECYSDAKAIIVKGHGGFRMDKGRFYSPALGRQFKNERDMRDYAKFNGLIEVGDEPPEKLARASAQIQEEKQNKFYEDLDVTTKMISKDL